MDLSDLQIPIAAIEETIVNNFQPNSSTRDSNTPIPVIKTTKKKKKVKKGLKTKKSKKNADSVLLTNIDDQVENDITLENKIRFRKYNLQDFKLLTLLGEGGFGKVYLARLHGHKAYFAIKFMEKKQIIDNNDYQSVLMEKKVMIYGNQNNFICRLFCSFQTSSHLCFAMEFCCGGDLKFHLNKEKRFHENKVRFYLAEILCAITYLHKLGIIYRDLKLDNVMIVSNGHIKLVDFGMCIGKIYRTEMMPSDFCGTIEYMAPEVIKGNRYNQSVDFWSLGIVAYEMSVGTYPFTGTEEEEICWFICHQNTNFPCFVSLELKNLISLLLTKNPEERLGMLNGPHGKIQEHSFFSNINWSEIENCSANPPYIPNINSACDITHFSDEFISIKNPPSSTFEDTSCGNCNLTDFDYTNPNLTD